MSESQQADPKPYQGIVDVLNNVKLNTGNGSSSWIGGLVAVVIVIIVIALLAFQAWQAGKAKAKALHEKAVREEQAHQAETDAKLAANAEEAQHKLDEAANHMKKVEELQQRIDEANKAHADAIEQINKITSWDQVDQLLKDQT